MLPALALTAFLTQQPDPALIMQKLSQRLSEAKGLTYEVKTTTIKAGKEKPFMRVKARAMRPNLVSGESEIQCWYSDGNTSVEFAPMEKEYINREVDKTGFWLPMGNGLLSFCAPSIYKPNYTRAKNVTFNNKAVICLEMDEPEVPGLVAKLYIDPKTWLPTGWEQVTADSILRAIYISIDTEKTYAPESFRWTPPKDAIDSAKVKRVSKLLAVGKAAPMLAFKDVNGKTIDMKRMLKGKKGLLLNFWYYGCGWCQREFPHLQSLYASAQKNGLGVLTINAGEDTIAQIKALTKAAKLTLPIATNGQTAVKQYGVEAFPTNYLLNANGKIVYRNAGYGEESFAALIEAIKGLGIQVK
ncbi:MAG: redoxin domain-containing protein [Fimbriimonadaceae bacterium]